MESIKNQHSHLSELVAFKCPLCGNMLGQKRYNEVIEEFNFKTDQMYKVRYENQRKELENKIKDLEKLLREERLNQSEFWKNFYSDQTQSTIKEIERAFKYQLNQSEVLRKETEQNLNKKIEELTKSQAQMKEHNIEEGRKLAFQDIQNLENKITQKDNEITQKNIQLDRLKNDLEKLRNETSSTQSELKGEAGELDLYMKLKRAFPTDDFERQKRGSSSGDIIQYIKTSTGSIEMPIVFDNKESTSISKLDLEKARRYKTIHRTNYVIIVSKNLPKKECSSKVIGEKDGILLVHPSFCRKYK